MEQTITLLREDASERYPEDIKVLLEELVLIASTPARETHQRRAPSNEELAEVEPGDDLLDFLEAPSHDVARR